LAFHTLPLALGVSKKYDLIMNSMAVPRKAKQAIGGIVRLTHANTGQVR
jgi:UDP-sugar pyrophosphorylase